MIRVSIDDPARMNLLGLMLGDMLARNLAQPERQRDLAALRGEVVVEAGAMAVTLRLNASEVTISRGGVARPAARIAGSLDTLLQLALGGGLVRPWLAGRLKARGQLRLLLGLRRVLRLDEA